MILKLLPRDLLQFTMEEETEEKPEEGLPKDIMVNAERYEIDLPMVEGVDWNYGLMHLNDPQLLMNTVGDFYKTLEAEADKLDDFYRGIKEEPDMLDQYRIKVHSMKSSANLIGAAGIGGMAKMLEDAARRKDVSYIEALHEMFIKEWRSYKEKMQDCIKSAGKEEQQEKKTADTEEIISYLEQLREAMLEMDIDSMDENMEKLEEYQYEDAVQKNIEKLSVLVTNMDSDEAVNLIEEIMDEIK